jgi:two-component system, cell cycle response regulator
MQTSEAVEEPLNVLVVDDDAHVRGALARAVRDLGHVCSVAADGEDALETYRDQGADVIVSDWMMPGLTGPELCSRIRAEPGAYVYFVLATGLDDRDHLRRGMRAGADDYLTKPVDLDQLAARLAVAARVVTANHKLGRENRRLRRDSERLFADSRIDALTGVGNRRRMDEDVHALGANADRYGRAISAALVDIDRFKRYNDHFGHPAGDELLRRVATTIAGELRAGDSVYRYGGEEFLVLLDAQPLSMARVVMERIRRAVEALAIPTYPSGVITISAGVAERRPNELPHQDDGRFVDEDWVARADQAMYAAKHQGRNRVCG